VPGFRFSVASYVVSLLRPEIIRDLNLPRFGLDILPLDGTFTPLRKADKAPKGGDYLWRVNDHGRTVRELRRWSKHDAEAYEEYGQLMVEMARFIKPILGIVPADPTDIDPRPLLPLAGPRRRFQQLPERQQAVFVQLMTMSAADFLDQWFETDPLKATMSASGIIGTYQGIRSPAPRTSSSTTTWARSTARSAPGDPQGRHRRREHVDRPRGRGAGAEIRTEAPVARVIVRNGKATGVALASGEEIEATHVLSLADAKVTFLDLLEAGTSSPSSSRRSGGSSSAAAPARSTSPSTRCRASPACPGVGEHLRGAISFSPSMAEMERAYDDAKYGRWSERPYIDMIIPTLVDPQMAPPGKHVISCFVQYAPYKLAPELGHLGRQRQPGQVRDAVINRIAEFAPNIRTSSSAARCSRRSTSNGRWASPRATSSRAS
jgi:phytoene dehydrogenase-like protein